MDTFYNSLIQSHPNPTERQRDRETERQRDKRQRDKETETQRQRQRQRDGDRGRDRETERQRDRDRDRDRDRGREREKDRKRERDRERINVGSTNERNASEHGESHFAEIHRFDVEQVDDAAWAADHDLNACYQRKKMIETGLDSKKNRNRNTRKKTAWAETQRRAETREQRGMERGRRERER